MSRASSRRTGFLSVPRARPHCEQSPISTSTRPASRRPRRPLRASSAGACEDDAILLRVNARMLMKKLLLAFALVLLCLIGTAEPAQAQEWPQRQIRIIVSFGPGGGADIIGRILADAMQPRFGKPVIVENKPGAGGILGNESVAKAAPDGYTI